MYCRKCGCLVEEDEIYCPHCSRIIKRSMWSISALSVSLIAIVFVLVYVEYRPVFEGPSEVVATEEFETKVYLPDVTEAVGEKAKTDKLYAILESNRTDYNSEQLLDYTLYERYEYDENFSFGYPSSIYNQISESDSERDGCFGRVIREVGLGCDDDSYVNFSLTARIDGRSFEDMTDIVYEYESGFIYEGETIMKRADDSHGIVILKGFTSDELDAGVYNLIRIEPEYIYQMRIYYPTPKTEEEENHINYYLDTMYRLCEFSGSTTQPRSYVEYLIYKDENKTSNSVEN